MDPEALIVTDMRQAEEQLVHIGYKCTRLTHNELLSGSGTEYNGKLLKGTYALLWISTPNDWYVRTPTIRSAAHWTGIIIWIKVAHKLDTDIVLFGPPGFLWELPMLKIRFCHFGDKFASGKPSGSYLQVASTQKINPRT